MKSALPNCSKFKISMCWPTLEVKFSNTSFKKLHQWKYVEAENPPNDNYFIDYNEKIAVCGDWFIDSRVEGAFTSANELSKEIL